MQPVLLDTGALVAYLDKDDPHHEECDRVFRTSRASFITTEAVLTEVAYLLETPRNQQFASDFIIRGGAALIETTTTALKRIAVLMQKYADIPMDYADATLVNLAEAMDIDVVFTLDRRGFQSYRIKGRRPFALLP